jgi:predicted metal-dependent hydrolase
MLISTVLFTLNITRFASMLLEADGVPAWRARLGALNYLFGKPGLFRKSWRAYWDWFRPGFHPWDHDNRHLLETWRPRFQAVETSVAA